MLTIYVLGSGSEGNCTVVKSSLKRCKGKFIMLDCGVTYLKEKLKKCGLSIDGMDTCLITHNHSDHNRQEKLVSTGPSQYYFTASTDAIHDAPDSKNYFVSDGQQSVYYRCDSPVLIDRLEKDYIEEADIIISECNYSEEAHDTDMVDGIPVNRPYNEDLKRRIRSTGHMSNEEFVDNFSRYDLENKYLLISHKSRLYNSTQTIERDVIPHLKAKGFVILENHKCPYKLELKKNLKITNLTS